MAFDKAVDSTALNAGLTKIADAIRAKGGTEGTMAFPDGFAEMIEAIQAGGGGRTVKTGTLVFPANTGGPTITHGLGETPYFFLVFAPDNQSFITSPSLATQYRYP